MRKAILATAIISTGITTAALAAPATVNGRWLTKDRDAVVEIGKCGATICGRIQRFIVKPPQGNNQRDINNPDKSKRSRKLLGMAVLTGFKPSGKQWRGRIYDPKAGKSYRSVMFKTKSGKLTVKGCIGPICQNQTWTRAR